MPIRVGVLAAEIVEGLHEAKEDRAFSPRLECLEPAVDIPGRDGIEAAQRQELLDVLIGSQGGWNAPRIVLLPGDNAVLIGPPADAMSEEPHADADVALLAKPFQHPLHGIDGDVHLRHLRNAIAGVRSFHGHRVSHAVRAVEDEYDRCLLDTRSPQGDAAGSGGWSPDFDERTADVALHQGGRELVAAKHHHGLHRNRTIRQVAALHGDGDLSPRVLPAGRAEADLQPPQGLRNRPVVVAQVDGGNADRQARSRRGFADAHLRGGW